MRLLVVWAVVSAACGNKQSEPAGGSAAAAVAVTTGSAVGSASGMLTSTVALDGVAATGGLGIAGPHPSSWTMTDAATKACAPACAHRTSCGLDGARCTEECAALYDLGSLSAADLTSYAAARCDQVKQIEPQFRVATACRHACGHRAECTGADLKECLPDCGALLVASKQDPSVLGAYVRRSCDEVKAQEPQLTCLHACTHALNCGVAGDLRGCVAYCGDQLKQGVTLETIVAIGKLPCNEVEQKVQLPQGGNGNVGGSGHQCRAEGIYTVCDGGSCHDRSADSLGAGGSDAEARDVAVRSCNSHLTSMMIIAQMANRASVKQTCQITTCH